MFFFLFRITNRYIYNQHHAYSIFTLSLLPNVLWNAFFWKDMCNSLHSLAKDVVALLKGSRNTQKSMTLGDQPVSAL